MVLGPTRDENRPIGPWSRRNRARIMAGMPNDLAPLFDRIRTLADEPAEGDPERLLVEMEHTLTDGYAHALALETESIRLERAIGEALAAGAEIRGSRDELTILAG